MNDDRKEIFASDEDNDSIDFNGIDKQKDNGGIDEVKDGRCILF